MGFRCGAAEAANDDASKEAASAKTKRLRLNIVNFIRPSRIFTGDFRRDLAPTAGETVAVPTRYLFAALGAMIARRVATMRKAKGKSKKAKEKAMCDSAAFIFHEDEGLTVFHPPSFAFCLFTFAFIILSLVQPVSRSCPT